MWCVTKPDAATFQTFTERDLQMSKNQSFSDLSAAAKLNADEIKSAVDVIEIIGEYRQQNAQLSMQKIKLSDFVASSLIDSGKIPGHVMGGGTLERYDANLAIALRKLESVLPDYSKNPLAAYAD
jgi:hypothetical protein